MTMICMLVCVEDSDWSWETPWVIVPLSFVFCFYRVDRKNGTQRNLEQVSQSLPSLEPSCDRILRVINLF